MTEIVLILCHLIEPRKITKQFTWTPGLTNLSFPLVAERIPGYTRYCRIEERFEKDFFQDFTRNDESAPCWKISRETPNSIKVYLTSHTLLKKLKILKQLLIRRMTKILVENSPCDVICHSKPLSLFYKNTFFSIEQVDNHKSLIEKIFNIGVPIPFVNSEKLFWKKIINFFRQRLCNFLCYCKRLFQGYFTNNSYHTGALAKVKRSIWKWL